MKGIKDYKKLVEFAVYLRGPILLRWFEKGVEIFDIIKHFKLTAPALLDEIFIEEERELSARYEGVLRAISIGKSSLGEILVVPYEKM